METADTSGASNRDSGIDYSSIHSSFFSIPMMNPDNGDERTVIVAWPTDQQWIRRQRSRVISIRSLGRGMTETKVEPDEDVSLSIYNQIRQPSSPDLEPADADFILDHLSSCDVVGVDRDQGLFLVHMDFPGADAPAVHSLRCPTMGQIRKYENSKVSSRQGRFGLTKLQLLIEPAEDLYNELTSTPALRSSPIIHKSAAIEAVIEEIKSRVEAKAKTTDTAAGAAGSGFPQ